jgi:hypothetical protein
MFSKDIESSQQLEEGLLGLLIFFPMGVCAILKMFTKGLDLCSTCEGFQ